jgi:hypothetical protein
MIISFGLQIVCFEGSLEVCFNRNIKSRRFKVLVRRVIDSRDGCGGGQVVQVKS